MDVLKRLYDLYFQLNEDILRTSENNKKENISIDKQSKLDG